jgi:hypothetical protein
VNINNLKEKRRLIPFFRIGELGFILNACTPDAEKTIGRFFDLFSGSPFLGDSYSQEIQYLIIASLFVPEKKRPPKWLPKNVHESWIEFIKAWSSAYKRFWQIRKLASLPHSRQVSTFIFAWPRIEHNNIDAFSFSAKQNQSIQFFGLVIEKPDEYSHLKILGCSLFLATWWHIVHGGLLLHSAAVGKENNGFLFLGGSKAGKTSVAELSTSMGYLVLGDDLNFVIRDKENNYILSACPSPNLSPVGYSSARPSLKAVFTLIKDDNEYLKPISSMQTAHALFDSFMQTPSARRLPSKVVGLAFSTACEIARKVPGYELHFRKSPDFWNIIDKGLEK